MGGTMTGEPARQRSGVRAVAIPTEHGGWSLTLEPGLLGLLVAPSVAGLALALGALTAFVARTPLKLVLVDRWRGRRLPRTVVAERVALAEMALLAALAAGAAATASGPFWVPLLLAAPLLVVELWFDMRSRGRRLVPEVAGTLGIGSVVAAVVLADDGEARLASGLWLVMAARAVASLPFVRFQLARAKHWTLAAWVPDTAQVVGVALAAMAVLLVGDLWPGFVVIVLVALLHLVEARRRPPVAAMLGMQQVVVGAAVVLAAGLGVVVG